MRSVLVFIIIVALFFIGYNLHETFFSMSLSFLNTEAITLEPRTSQQARTAAITFGVVLALIPLYYLLVKRASQLNTIPKHIITIALILILGCVFWRLRIFGLNFEIAQLLQLNFPETTRPEVKRSYLKLEIYFLMGCIVGTLIALLWFRDRSRPLVN